ncbi:MAG: hypothetical protein KDA87_17670 [Planctomycetales bacterium]|nr:hypothetical protein [Planctomycetales bacterium]
MSANLPSSPIAFQRSQNPRLSIFHLLLYTSVTATLFAIARPMFGSVGDQSAALTVVLSLLLLFQSAQFFAALVVTSWLFRNDAKPIAPGEWMVLAAVSQLLGHLFPVPIPMGAIVLLIAIALRRIMLLWSITFGLLAVTLSAPLIAVLIYVYSSTKTPTRRAWLDITTVIHAVIPIVCVLLLMSYIVMFMACRSDRQRGYKGGWLHSLGLGLALPTLTVTIGPYPDNWLFGLVVGIQILRNFTQ